MKNPSFISRNYRKSPLEKIVESVMVVLCSLAYIPAVLICCELLVRNLLNEPVLPLF